LYKIHEISTKFKNQSDLLKEISVNAAIAAGHAGSQIKVFTEIANQIGAISNTLEDGIHRIHFYTGFMSNKMLECLRNSSQSQKFEESLERVQAESNNSKLIFGIKKQFDNKIIKMLDAVQSNLIFLRPESGRLKQFINRVWSIVISLRVSASASNASEKEFYLSIAEALNLMVTETETLVDLLVKTIDAVDEKLENRCDLTLGSSHAL
jgi:hypothetical protein